MRFIEHILGLNDPSSFWYLFYSGFGSDIGEITLIGALFRIAYKAKQQRDKHHQQLREHIDYKFNKLTEEDSK